MGNREELKLDTDVLVIGGGPAGTWAALTAAERGADVVLVDKGYCGTSGATAPSGTSVLYVNPEPKLREQARTAREALGGYLSDDEWSHRIMHRTYENVNRLADLGYPFPAVYEGYAYRSQLQGPEYMRLMRKLVKRAGVRILDHSPALELIVDEHGVGGARGTQTQKDRDWTIRAGAVVIAAGGCAFLSKALGCNVLTGDSYLLAAESGADLSGMEFSNHYSLSPAFSSVTKGRFFNYATFYYEDGTVIEGAGSQKGRSLIAKTLLNQPVYARLDQVEEYMKEWMPKAQPNFFLPFRRKGIDPFRDLFPVTLRLEGTVRGTGGIHLTDESCGTKVPGLYAAGDAATRELLCGGFTGGGSYNAAWAISSGYWAGEGAALYAKRLGPNKTKRNLTGASGAALKGYSASTDVANSREIVKAVQDEILPYDKNLFRTEETLTESLRRLDHIWSEIKRGIGGVQNNLDRVRAREAEAMAATGRWMYTTALDRKETRGMHKRLDYPELDETTPLHRLITSGTDQIEVSREYLKTGKKEAAAV
ncbi:MULTISPECIES: FAD-dependent oxidoreductase [unclassified Paenibacillus]|uniref:FAD-dependent oxidoreductase n=1 Tax=unclassified Paenibacillus TaxID=185978 RepID=UPI0006D25A0E|nr:MULTISPECIES: FAD-binding protein [unclassified Paenibacillus]